MPENEEIQSQLESLNQAYAASLTQRLEQQIEALNSLHQQADPHACLAEIFRQIHSISGSAGTFGFNALGKQAHELELALKEFQQRQQLPDSQSIAYLNSGFHKLIKLVTMGRDAEQPALSSPALFVDSENENKLFFVLEDDASQGQSLCLQLNHYGYHTQLFTSVAEIRQALTQKRPDALVLDIITPEGHLAGTELAIQIRQDEATPIPIIFISSNKSWETRLAAVRAGGSVYLEKPVDISSLIENLDQLTQRVRPEPFRILIIDDAIELAQHYSLVLRQAGMETEILTEPAGVLDFLAQYKAELIMLDYYLPGITGPEIARVLRQHKDFFSIPIVFLSTETDLDIQLDALQQADDFLEKPISDLQLLSAVSARIIRARNLNHLMYHDSLTGLLNQLTLKRRLETEMARCERQGSPLSYLMLDIDHFKQVNDTCGHMAGDNVLKSLAYLLKERLRKTDHIGRYGGEEFGIIMPDTTAQIAVEIIEGIRQAFCQLSFQHKTRRFSCSFSAGVACASVFKLDKKLIEAADDALYQAKDMGRNQTTLHDRCRR